MIVPNQPKCVIPNPKQISCDYNGKSIKELLKGNSTDSISLYKNITVDNIEKYKNEIQWFYLTIYNKNILNPDVAKRFVKNIYWNTLIARNDFDTSLLNKCGQYINWHDWEIYDNNWITEAHLWENIRYIQKSFGSEIWYPISEYMNLSSKFLQKFTQNMDWEALLSGHNDKIEWTEQKIIDNIGSIRKCEIECYRDNPYFDYHKFSEHFLNKCYKLLPWTKILSQNDGRKFSKKFVKTHRKFFNDNNLLLLLRQYNWL